MKRFLILGAVCLALITGCSKQSFPQFPQTYTIQAQTDKYELTITQDEMTLEAKEFVTTPITVSYTDRIIKFDNLSVSLDEKTEKLLFVGELINMVFTGQSGDMTEDDEEYIFTGSHIGTEYVLHISKSTCLPISLSWGELTVNFT